MRYSMSCFRCGHKWLARGYNLQKLKCPKCKTGNTRFHGITYNKKEKEHG